MNIIFKENQTEQYYRKILLLDKLKPYLKLINKRYIFDKGYCWDILFNDKHIMLLCYDYAKEIKRNAFPEGEPYIATNATISYLYAKNVLFGRFPLGEKILSEDTALSFKYAMFVLEDRFPLGEKRILENSFLRKNYLSMLYRIGKHHEVKI